jgi:glycosyltransferase involved in cell wall biosynthesis
MLEALACGVPVAAFPVQGPKDVIADASVASLHDDLRTACLQALSVPRDACRAFALSRSWRACTEQFLSNLPSATPPAGEGSVVPLARPRRSAP